MTYYTQLYTPETYVAFGKLPDNITGVRPNQGAMAERLRPGDKLVCYMTHFSRWVGLLRVTGRPYRDETPLLMEGDPFTLRFPVEREIWLDVSSSVPIHHPPLWQGLSFTRGLDSSSSAWTGKVRRSLYSLSDEDGELLEQILRQQTHAPQLFPIEPNEFERSLRRSVRRSEGQVLVSVPTDEPAVEPEPIAASNERISLQIQASLCRIGEALGYRVWLPRNDRSRVLQYWSPGSGTLLESLPLSYDDVTIRTIEQIDVLWIQNRTIKRAFEVEHTTAIYSGLLRMADLLALQGNMQIALHIVAPSERQETVFAQITRPVFSLLETAPLSERCTYLSYESVRELERLPHLDRMKDAVLEDYAETVE